MDEYLKRTAALVEKTASGAESVDFEIKFYKELAKLHEAHATSLLALCESRIARQQRMFQSTTVEHRRRRCGRGWAVP